MGISAATAAHDAAVRAKNCVRGRLAALLATSVLILPFGAAHAQDATWLASPGSADFNTGTNWSTGTVPTGTASFDTSSTIDLSFSADATLGGWTFNSGASDYTFTTSSTYGLTFTGAGITINGGSASITNNHFLTFSNTSAAGGASITSNGAVQFYNTSSASSATITNNVGETIFHDGSTAGGATITNNNGGYTLFYDNSSANSATITNNLGGFIGFYGASTAGSATITSGTAAIFFYGTSTAGTATLTNGGNNGNMQFYASSSAGSANITINDTASVSFRASATASSANITNNYFLGFTDDSTADKATITNNSGGTTYFSSSASGGTARFIMNGTGALDISDLTSNSTTAGSIEGNGNVFLGSKTLTVGGNNLSTTFSGVIQDGGISGGTGGALTKEGSGTLILTGTNTYSGATTVNSGTLEVDGSIASSSSVTVNAGGTLTGTGIVDPPAATTINAGGTLTPGTAGVPGTFMTITGNLMFQPGATYAVSLDLSSTTYATVSGTASLAGTVNASFAAGSYVAKQYDILKSAGLGGTTFDALSTSNLPANFNASLSYTTTDVLLNLAAALGSGANLNRNQQNVANSINTYFNNGGTLPSGFANLFSLSGNSLSNALSQVSGEAGAGAQDGAFQLMNEFLLLMFDQGFNGQGGAQPSFPLGYASEAPALSNEAARAYASVLKAPPAHPARRWSVWASGFGGYNKTNGDAVTGSHDATARTYGGAAGLDYHLTPDTVVGFALSGGGTNWGLAQGLGGGRSDVFQAGVHGRTQFGAAYVSAAAAFAEHWMTTDRYAFGNDHLTADFKAYDVGGRLEGGYRLGSAMRAITPYAAVQAQRFHTPDYSETDLTGGGFALSYASHNAHDTRSELGARFDTQLAATADAMLRLSGKLAWAHDWVSDPSLTAAFQLLPGSSFVVDGAAAPKDSTLVSAAAELRFGNGVSFLATFDGDFGNGSQTYAGTGTLRYTW